MTSEDFDENTLMIWEFKADTDEKRKIEIKHRALDEIFGFIGGNLSIVMMFFRFFLVPFSFNKFITKHSVTKDEI